MGWVEDTLQANGTLKNKLGITDSRKLAEVELRIVTLKYESAPSIEIKSIEQLSVLHAWLFSDLYDWAGKYRPGDFQKGATIFFPHDRFPLAIENLNYQIDVINQTSYRSIKKLSQDLARLLLDINNFHPFREGNGRAQRLFIVMFAKQKGAALKLSKNSSSYKTYMHACKNDDLDEMIRILFRASK